ncbi:MAG: RsiV family protein [Lachnospiraceae bacterium]|nr:RsiV family protein [Lachnospiraceae bacterium]
MKNRLYRGIAAIALSAMVLSGCGQAKPAADSEVQNEETNAAEAELPEGEEAEGTQEPEYSSPITIINHKLSCKIEDKERATGEYPEIILADEYKQNFPKLYDRIKIMNEEWEINVSERVAEYALWATEDPMYEDEAFSGEEHAWIPRADEKLFTVGTSYFDYAGGAHPNHGTSTINIDPVTGDNVRLDSVLNDKSILSGAIRTYLETNYPGVMEEVDSYYFPYEDDDPDEFVDKLNDDTYTWYIDETGLNIIFSPYEIASYATSYLEAVLSVSDYPDLIKKEYQVSEPFDAENLISEVEGDVKDIEAHENPAEADADPTYYYVQNPTWKSFTSENAGAEAAKHVSLAMTAEDKYDYMDTAVWANKNGFELTSFPYSDGTYYYEASDPLEYDYMYNTLKIYTADKSELLYNLDLYRLCNGPDDEEGRYSNQWLYLNWAEMADGILYVSTVYGGYSSENPWSNYIVAIDPEAREVLWRSAPLTNNAENFKIVDDTIICGYGFTAEPDYIYLLDKFTGKEVDKIKVNSAPYRFEIKDDTLYVATYNTAYEFMMNKY